MFFSLNFGSWGFNDEDLWVSKSDGERIVGLFGFKEIGINGCVFKMVYIFNKCW